MNRVIFGSNILGIMRQCPVCNKRRILNYRSQPDIGTVYDSGKRDERYEEELSCGHSLDTYVYADGNVQSILIER